MTPHFAAIARKSKCRVLQSIDLVMKTASRYYARPTCIDLEDLVQEGLEAVIRKQSRFDPDRGDWEAFVIFVAKGAMRDALICAQFVRLPRDAVKNHTRIKQLMADGLTAEQIAQELSLPVKACKATMDSDSYHSQEYLDVQESPGNHELSTEAYRVARQVAKLPQRQRMAVTGRAQGYTLAELGEMMGMTTQAVDGHSRAGIKSLTRLF